MEIDDIQYEELKTWVETGKSGDIPHDLVTFLERLEMVRSLYSKHESKASIIKILTSEVYGLSEFRANRIFSMALNFFYADNSIRKEAWRNILAEKLQHSADVLWNIAETSADFETYRRILLSIYEVLGVDKPEPFKLPDEIYDRRPVIYVLDTEKLGIPKVSRRALAEFIDSLPVKEKEKVRAKMDAMIEDIDFIENFHDEDQSPE